MKLKPHEIKYIAPLYWGKDEGYNLEITEDADKRYRLDFYSERWMTKEELLDYYTQITNIIKNL